MKQLKSLLVVNWALDTTGRILYESSNAGLEKRSYFLLFYMCHIIMVFFY